MDDRKPSNGRPGKIVVPIDSMLMPSKRLAVIGALLAAGHGHIKLTRPDSVAPKCMKCNKPIFADMAFEKTSLGKMHEACCREVVNALPVESVLEAPLG